MAPDLPAALADDLGFLLARASGVAVRAANDALLDQGLRVRHLSLMQLIADQPMTQREVSAGLGLDPSNVVALVDDLERLELVQRLASPRDRRTRLVELTPRGRNRLGAARTAADDALAGALSGLTAKQRDQLAGLLRAVR